VKRLFNLDLQTRWGTFSIYEKFEHLIITLLTAIIAAIVGAATWQLILHTFDLVRSHLLDPRDSQVFQTVFGMVLTVLIAMWGDAGDAGTRYLSPGIAAIGMLSLYLPKFYK
jgi:H+/Cl- antiporter ClcA